MTGPGRPRWRRYVLVALGLAAAAVAANVLYDSSDEVLAAADTLTRPHWGWVAAALVAELASYLFRAAAHMVVLRRGVRQTYAVPVDPVHPVASGGSAAARRPATPGMTVLSAGTLAGDAAAYCLPLGFAASAVVLLGVLRRRGVDSTVAAWMYAVCSVLYTASITLLTIVAVQVAGTADPIPGLRALSIGLLAALVMVGVGYALARRHRVKRAAADSMVRSGVGLSRGSAAGSPLSPGPSAAEGGPLGYPSEPLGAPESSGQRDGTLARARHWVRRRVAELRVIRLPAHTGALAFGYMTASWLCSISILGMAYEAVGTSPPWAGLLLAFCASQIAAALPITPGGIGVVEGSLTVALVAFGGSEAITFAAVLLYRLVTYWVCIPLGGLAWLALRIWAPPRRASEALAAPAHRGEAR